MSVIAVQAGTGRMVIDDDVEHARRSLAAIEETSKRALDEMRRLLGVLRAETTDAAAWRRCRRWTTSTGWSPMRWKEARPSTSLWTATAGGPRPACS